ncbi:MAG TPA: phosphotransferase [Thermomicrobiales bacterium]
MTPSPELKSRVVHLLGADPVMWTPMRRGYTPAGRWVVRFATGRSAFVKVGTTPDTSAWLRAEYGIYSRLRGDFLPVLLGWEDGEAPVLVLEDLSQAAWPPPWSPGRVEQVRAALAAIAATPPPPGTPSIAVSHSTLRSWGTVASDPAPFLSLGLCSPEWLAAALPPLLAADAAAALDGEHLLHMDVRSDNLCFVGEQAVLVDWNGACRGNPLVDLAAWLPSLAAEGGPDPLTILPDAPEMAALMAGYFAARAGLPHPVGAPRVRAVQLTQLRVALPWAAASLGLPPLV